MLMTALKPVAEALAAIIGAARLMPSESCVLDEAGGRVLAADLYACFDNPPAPVSAMDGYALALGADSCPAGTSFTVIGESAAGHVFTGRLESGQAVRIFTGAHLPEGADSVLLQEDSSCTDAALTANEAVKKGQFVRPQGLDFQKNDVILPAGTQLAARHLALAALAGHDRLPVRRQPVVGILSSGDELVPAGQAPKKGELVNSNSVFLLHMLRAAGARPIDLGIIKDKEGALTAALEKAVSAHGIFDLLISTGGASVGTHDHIVSDITSNEAGDLGFWRIAMRPGKPLVFGHWRKMMFLGLPGNPVSAGVCSLVFVRPLIHSLTGMTDKAAVSHMRLASALPENDSRQDYIRARIIRDENGQLMARPFGRQDSSMLRNFSAADILIIRPPLAPAAKAGSSVPVLPLPDSF